MLRDHCDIPAASCIFAAQVVSVPFLVCCCCRPPQRWTTTAITTTQVRVASNGALLRLMTGASLWSPTRTTYNATINTDELVPRRLSEASRTLSRPLDRPSTTTILRTLLRRPHMPPPSTTLQLQVGGSTDSPPLRDCLS